MATVDPKDTAAVIAAQRSWLCERQKADTVHPILIKAIEGKIPKGADPALYKWVDHEKVWGKITTPIYTSGTLLNEILIDTDSEIWNDIRDGVRKLHVFCKENDIPHLMGFSGGKGVHFSIIFKKFSEGDTESSKELFTQVEKYNVDAYKTVRRALLFEIAKRANVDLEKIGLDKKKIHFGFAKTGSQVREFGTIRAPGKYKTLITEIPDEKPKPNELPLVFPDEVGIWNIRDTEYNKIAIDALEKEIEKAKNANEYTPISDENFKDIPILKFPCIDKLFKVGIRNGRYYAVVATVLMCNKCGISKDETKKHLTTLCKTFPGITQEETDTRINNALEMYGKDYRFSCIEIKETFPEHNLCNFSLCPIKEKIESVRGKPPKDKTDKPEKIRVPFDVVADMILKQFHIFNMRDTGQIYIYNNGVYKNNGAVAILDTHIRKAHDDVYIKYWGEINPTFKLSHIPKATTTYVNEALAYIRAYTHIPREEIDEAAKRYINLKNGLFNLSEWKFEEHDPRYLSISQSPINHDEKVTCPNISKFFEDVAHSEDINLLFEWIGYCLTLEVKHQKAVLVYGPPGTGKSVYLSLLEAAVGKESRTCQPLQKIENDKYSCAQLYGKKVNLCSDIPDTKMHQSNTFKALTSGIDTIRGENKFQTSFDFLNTAKLTFSANKIPEGPKDEAYYQRWILIEFPNRFRGTTKEVKGIIDSLTTEQELSGLLNLALKGLKKLTDTGAFSYTKTFAEIEKEYLLNSNPSAAFMDECIVMSTEDLDATILYTTFVAWCRTHNTELVSKIGFSRKISEMGYDSHRENEVDPITKKVNNNKKVIVWDNIQLRHTTNINKQKELGQDEEELGQDRKKSSCPEIKSQPSLVRQPKTVLGQDDFSIVVNKNKNISLHNNNIEDVDKLKMSYSKKLSGKVKTSCPSVCFFDSETCGQDDLKKPVSSCPDPVLNAKTEKLTESLESDLVKNITTKTLNEENEKTTEVATKSNLIVTAEEMAKAWEEEGI